MSLAKVYAFFGAAYTGRQLAIAKACKEEIKPERPISHRSQLVIFTCMTDKGAAAVGERMTRVLVSGCVGFIDSHLVERLLQGASNVIGIDCFIDYYQEEHKLANLSRALNRERFVFFLGLHPYAT